MSLMKTLARVAAGVMLAKGIDTMLDRRRQQSDPRGQQGRMGRTTGGGILGDLLNQGGQGARGGAQGGLGGMLGQVLGGQQQAGTGRRYGGPNSQGASGGLGGILDDLMRNASGNRGGSSGGLGSILGGLGGGAAAGGLGGVLGDLLGGRQQQAGGDALARHGAQPRNDATFGEVFNDALSRQDEPEIAPTPEQNAVAGLMLKAMIQAAKADGRIDERERERLLGALGDLDQDEQQFVRDQMAATVDPRALAREVPRGLEAQVYLMSLMAMDFDDEREAQYLHDLAEALGLERQAVNEIHEKVGVQNLYG